ncbi:hypothetical protein [Pseudarthrobacter sp. N5]|uniref:hypothetical protein n=1 Tax=Pseudarthrobacter sp. N5 TaxID=3418416 RepID=UPI003CEB1943
MSTPPVQPPNPNEPEPNSQPEAPQYGQNAPAAPQYGQNAPAAPQYGQNAPAAPQYGQNAPQYGQNAPAAPQYGQNAPQFGQNAPQYGQNAPQFGQNAPQYGQQPHGQSPYGQYPSEQPQGQGTTGIPKLVNIAFWLIVGAGAVWVLSLLLAIPTLDDPDMRRTFDQQIAAGGADIQFNDIKGFIVGTLVVFAIIGAGLYALVAFYVRKGKNWARILGTVFAALSIFGLGQLGLGALGSLAGIAAIVLLYLPASAPYFRKQQPFANPYGQPDQPGNPYRQ